MKLLFETKIDNTIATIKSGFNLDLFVALKPPFMSMNVERFDGCSPGHEVHLAINMLGKKQRWVSVITQEQNDAKEWSFVDEGRIMPWPLASWRHHHRVVYLDDKSSKIIDDINFECTHSWMNKFMYIALWPSFAVRPRLYKKFFQGK
jgi:ligand-binding SRPBCC domain-containing protein